MPAPGGTNMAGSSGEMYERPYAAYHEQSDPPWWFRHIPASYTGPTAIVFPGTLTAQERREVMAWLAAGQAERPNLLSKCTQRAAVAKITEYIAYYADASWLAWRDTDEGTRIAQWRLFVADGLIASKATVAKSADSGGIGSGEPTPPFVTATNLP